MKRIKKIGQMYAFVAENEREGIEGICSFHIPGISNMPMVGGDMKMVDSLRPLAQDIAKNTGKKVKLVMFTTRTELEVIK